MNAKPGSSFHVCVLVCVLALAWLVPTRSFAQLSEARRMAQRARGLTVSGQCDQALPVYDRAIQLSPSDGELVRDRGACHEKLGHRKAAADDYRAYCALVPGAADVPALQRRIAELEAPVARRPSAPAQPAPVAVAPGLAPASGGPPGAEPVAPVPTPGGYVPAPALPPPPPPVRGPGPKEEAESTEDKVRFRGGISAGAGGIFASGGPPLAPSGSSISAFMGGVDAHLGVQINNLIGVYVVPHLVFGPLSISQGGASVSSVDGVLSGTAVADVTLFDSFFVGAGGGYGIVNSPSGPVVHFRLGGYPLMEHGEHRGRRKGLMLGADLRLYFIDGLTFVEATGGIGYEAF